MSGMLGEAVVDETCWIMKCHHPFPKFPGNMDFTAKKCIVCVRNPFDTLVSCYNFVNSGFSQSAVLQNDLFSEEL